MSDLNKSTSPRSWLQKYLSVIISLCALVLSYVSFTQTLNLEAKSRQLDVVADIIEYIQNNPIDIRYSGVSYTATLFEIAVCPGKEIPDTAQIIFRYGEPYPVTFKEYAINPFVPKEIADIMVGYWSYDSMIYGERNMNNLTAGVFISNHPYVESVIAEYGVYPQEQDSWVKYYGFCNAPAYESWAEFVNHCEELKVVLRKWLHKKGVRDINIRDYDFMYL